MRMSCAFARIRCGGGDEKLKQELEKLVAAFTASYNKQDSAGLAAYFASGGVLVNPTGLHADIAKLYEGAFKAGFNHRCIA
jgi:ketosteroid isomerase-like protein